MNEKPHSVACFLACQPLSGHRWRPSKLFVPRAGEVGISLLGEQNLWLRTGFHRLAMTCRLLQYDNRAKTITKEGMRKGIREAAVFILFLSEGVLKRPYCQFEIREAISLEKPMVLVHGKRWDAQNKPHPI